MWKEEKKFTENVSCELLTRRTVPYCGSLDPATPADIVAHLATEPAAAEAVRTALRGAVPVGLPEIFGEEIGERCDPAGDSCWVHRNHGTPPERATLHFSERTGRTGIYLPTVLATLTAAGAIPDVAAITAERDRLRADRDRIERERDEALKVLASVRERRDELIFENGQLTHALEVAKIAQYNAQARAKSARDECTDAITTRDAAEKETAGLHRELASANETIAELRDQLNGFAPIPPSDREELNAWRELRGWVIAGHDRRLSASVVCPGELVAIDPNPHGQCFGGATPIDIAAAIRGVR